MKEEISVKTYSGYKGNERPVSFSIKKDEHFVEEIIDNWIGENFCFWKIIDEKGQKYLLKYDPASDKWTL